MNDSLTRYPALRVIAAALLLTGCLPPERPLSPRVASLPVRVRVQQSPASSVSSGVLVRLTTDSVAWSESSNVVRARALTDVARVEVAEPLSQREAFRRGAIKGGIVGALLGGALLAAKQDQVAGAVGLAAAGWWLGGVFSGQGAESSQPSVRWRVVHPAAQSASGGR